MASPAATVPGFTLALSTWNTLECHPTTLPPHFLES